MTTNQTQEVWKEIGNGYSVSNNGKVVKDGNLLKAIIREGVPAYSITRTVGKKKTKGIYNASKLVVHAFKRVPLSKHILLEHKDGNVNNNSLDNLTEQKKGRVGVNTPIAPNKVYKFDTAGNLVATYHSAYAAGIENDIAHCLISSVALNGNPIRNAFYRYSDVFDKADLARVNDKSVRVVRSNKGNVLYSYDMNGNFVRSFYTPADAKAFLNLEDMSHIYKAVNGKRVSAFGYMWSKRRYMNLLNYKKQQFNVVVKDSNNNVLWKAANYEDAAKRFGITLKQVHKAMETSQKGLFQNMYKLEKEYTHKF